LLAMIPVLLSPNSTVAQGDRARLALSNPNAFDERFSAKPVSGSSRGQRDAELLVGIRLSNTDSRFDPASIRVALGGDKAASGNICVRIITRDGRYSATATYLSQTRFKAPAIDAPTRYARELKVYRVSDLAVTAFVAPNCDIARAGELYATIIGKPENGSSLIVHVNASTSRIRAQLLKGGKESGAPVMCQQVEKTPRIGFTDECRLQAPDQAGTYRLVLTETAMNGSMQQRSFPVRIVAEFDP
jgi:hypothetical protein